MKDQIIAFFSQDTLPNLDAKWSIFASVIVVIGGIFAVIKVFFHKESSKSNKANVKHVKDSNVTIDQKN